MYPKSESPLRQRLALSSLTGCFAEGIALRIFISVLQPRHNLFRQHSSGDFHFFLFSLCQNVFMPQGLRSFRSRGLLVFEVSLFLKVMSTHVLVVVISLFSRRKCDTIFVRVHCLSYSLAQKSLCQCKNVRKYIYLLSVLR